MRKVCKRYVKLYANLHTNKESERRFNLNDEEQEEYTIRYHENYKHFEKLQEIFSMFTYTFYSRHGL